MSYFLERLEELCEIAQKPNYNVRDLPDWAYRGLADFSKDTYLDTCSAEAVELVLDYPFGHESEDCMYNITLDEYDPDYGWLANCRDAEEYVDECIGQYEFKEISKAVMFAKDLYVQRIAARMLYDLHEATGNSITLAKWKLENE